MAFGWFGAKTKHSLAANSIESQPSIPKPKPIAFSSDPSTMVKLSNTMNSFVSNGDRFDVKRQKFETDSYQYAYDYVRGSTKHYTSDERDRFMGNPNMLSYINMAYLDNVTPAITDERKKAHFLRNHKRAISDLGAIARKRTKSIELVAQADNVDINPVATDVQRPTKWWEKMLMAIGFRKTISQRSEHREHKESAPNGE